MEAKYEELLKYSNPKRVRALVKQYLGDDVKLYVSTRKNKKYMVIDPEDNKIHFGQMGMEDYSKHMDLKRRELFMTRNKRWKDAPMWSPAYLSYYLLWN